VGLPACRQLFAAVGHLDAGAAQLGSAGCGAEARSGRSPSCRGPFFRIPFPSRARHGWRAVPRCGNRSVMTHSHDPQTDHKHVLKRSGGEKGGESGGGGRPRNKRRGRRTMREADGLPVVPPSLFPAPCGWSHPPPSGTERPAPVYTAEDDQPIYRSITAMSSLSLSPPGPTGPPPPLRRQVTSTVESRATRAVLAFRRGWRGRGILAPSSAAHGVSRPQPRVRARSIWLSQAAFCLNPSP